MGFESDLLKGNTLRHTRKQIPASLPRCTIQLKETFRVWINLTKL